VSHKHGSTGSLFRRNVFKLIGTKELQGITAQSKLIIKINNSERFQLQFKFNVTEISVLQDHRSFETKTKTCLGSQNMLGPIPTPGLD
jgi:hypothetical protein